MNNKSKFEERKRKRRSTWLQRVFVLHVQGVEVLGKALHLRRDWAALGTHGLQLPRALAHWPVMGSKTLPLRYINIIFFFCHLFLSFTITSHHWSLLLLLCVHDQSVRLTPEFSEFSSL